MSHFAVMVVTENGTEQEVEAQLAPFHEFECTGVVDEFVQNVSELEDAAERYQDSKITYFKSPDGKLYNPWMNRFFREFTPEEQERFKPFGSGSNGVQTWLSRDWNDGKGYRPKMHYLPEGWEKVEIPVSDVKSFREFVVDNYDLPFLALDEEPDLFDKHKWGWYALDAQGNVTELIRRTNPNKKWDWWVIGGRWENMLLTKNGEWVNSCRKADIDIEKMREVARKEALTYYDKVMAVIGPHLESFLTWEEMLKKFDGNAEKALEAFSEQPLFVAKRASQDPDINFCLPNEFRISRDEFGNKRANKAILTYAFLRNREWQAHDDDKQSDWEDWKEHFQKLFDSIPDDHYVTVVDCHI